MLTVCSYPVLVYSPTYNIGKILLHASKHYIKLIVVHISISSYSTIQLQHFTPSQINDSFPLDLSQHSTRLEYSSFKLKSNYITYLVYSKDFLKTIHYKAYCHCTGRMYSLLVISPILTITMPLISSIQLHFVEFI